MNKNDFKNAFREAASSEFEHVPANENDIDFTFSERFNERMKKLVKSQKKPYYGFVNTAYKRVAVICVAFLTMAATAVNVEAVREPMTNLINYVFDTHTDYLFTGYTKDKITEEYTVKIPDGFEQINETKDYMEISREYENDRGDIIMFSQETTKGSSGYSIDNEHGEIETKTVGEFEVIYKKAYDTQLAFWTKYGYVFNIRTYGDVDYETIENMIKSFERVKS